MAANFDFYIKQADLCGEAADTTALQNQRETLLRSRAAWLKLAKREEDNLSARLQREEDRTLSRNEESSLG